MGALTSAKAKRLAIIVTLVLATISLSPNALEPILEEKIDSALMLIVAKGMIFATLIPIEIIGSRLASATSPSQGR